ncbi:hypothetical protein MIMGU_mgv1a022653mg [Erythranthe guttata]|uniref:F-box domain-containing protein n=1 Tax=Erythranthe guttata TaxID=4155 RepID=A0A022RWJ3_ERYGU|nr:hypothetical protein MIMGU_mgv1a022653mg [Erythranthe guttata]
MTTRRKFSSGEHNPATIDGISLLPDTILCHILSFLPTKSSVRTSALSKRWLSLWSYVPNLDFESEHQDIINRVTLLHKALTINTFSLIQKNDSSLINENEYQLETWIMFAVARNVKNLHLSVVSNVFLPRRLFTCETLVNLRLDDCGVVPNIGGGGVRLPRLKKLHLTYVLYEGDESISNLLSGCPVLEELVMELIWGLVRCNVTSPSIERLTLDFQSNGKGGIGNREYWVEINAPALRYLKMTNCYARDIKCGTMNSLIEADIDIYNYNDFPYSRFELEFIHRLRNVECLHLDLAHCTGFYEEIECWMEPQQVPKCLSSHLRFVRLSGVGGKQHEYEYIQYLLRNANVLERMEISPCKSIGFGDKFYMLQKISMFRRGSDACEVAFDLVQ